MVDLNVLVAACLTINPKGKVDREIDISPQFQCWGSRLFNAGDRDSEDTESLARGVIEGFERWVSNRLSRLDSIRIFRRDAVPWLTFRHFCSLFGLVDSNAGSGDNGVGTLTDSI